MKNELAGKQLLCEKEHEMVLTMQGESLKDVTGKLFQAMRKQVFQDIKEPIIHMEAVGVYFEKIESKKMTEHFMLFFWPREKASYTVTAKIVVKIKYLNITEEGL